MSTTQTFDSTLKLDRVTAGYGPITVLRDISFAIAANSVTAVLGPNGAGKTTLLNVMSGVLRTASGSVELLGVPVTNWSADRRANAGICHIPEGKGIFRKLTVRENLVLQARRGDEANAVERAVSVFPVLGERLTQVAGTMSGGQQQMLAISRAYVRDFKLILVDEPSLGLAPIIVDAIFEFLESVTKNGTTLVLVDQFVNRALAMAQHVIIVNHGEILFTGTPAELERTNLFEQYLGFST